MWSIISLLGLGSLPTLASSLITMATPFMKAGLDIVMWYLKRLWEGIKDIVDNPSTVLTVASIVLATYLYVSSYQKEQFITTHCVEAPKYKDAAYDRFKNIFSH